MNTTTNFRTVKMVQLALFTAIIVLMAFTPIGYIKTFGLEIALIVVPVAIGAVTLGPAGGAVLGAVFGITSFIQCFGMSPFGAALLNINPLGTFVLCMVPRILMGWLTGLIFKTMNRFSKTLSYAVANLAGPLLNTILFMTTLVLFFYRTDFIQGFVEKTGAGNVFAFIIAFVGINGLIEAIVCFVLGTAVSKAIDIFARKSGMK
jgi:Predicted membrane protein